MKNNKWLKDEIMEASTRLTFRTEEFVVDFINQVYELMDNKGITQTDLSVILNKKSSYISRILNAPHNITAKTMVSLAMALNCEIKAPKLFEIDDQVTQEIPDFNANAHLNLKGAFCLMGEEGGDDDYRKVAA